MRMRKISIGCARMLCIVHVIVYLLRGILVLGFHKGWLGPIARFSQNLCHCKHLYCFLEHVGELYLSIHVLCNMEVEIELIVITAV
jgi:hypothetical protein